MLVATCKYSTPNRQIIRLDNKVATVWIEHGKSDWLSCNMLVWDYAMQIQGKAW